MTTGAAEAVPQPGSPEYEAAYNKAFEGKPEGEGGASGTPGDKPKPDDKPAGESPPTGEPPAAGTDEPPSPTDDGKPHGGEPTLADALEQNRQLSAQLQSTLNALKDTQKWGRTMAQRMREVQSAIEQQKRGERPKILDDFTDLEQAIDYVMSGKKEKPNGEAPKDDLEPPAFDFDDKAAPPAGNQPANGGDPVKAWTETVMAGCPDDLGDLLGIAEFKSQVEARKAALGPKWANPLVAIKEFNQLRTDWLRKSAEKEAEKRARNKGKMDLPAGGASGAAPSAPENDQAAYDAVMNESPDKFQQRKSATLGF